jgi:inner membrane protein
MPSPLGHALGGLATGWLIKGGSPQFRTSLFFAAAGVLPDADLLFGAHSGPTHGLGAAIIVGAVVAMATRYRDVRLALAVAAAYASHTLLDWLGSDSSAPIGIMALWPFRHAHYESDLHVFHAISRRYWLPGFWTSNLHAIARELAILVPIAIGAFLVARLRGRGRSIVLTVLLGVAAPPSVHAQITRGYLDALRLYQRGSFEKAILDVNQIAMPDAQTARTALAHLLHAGGDRRAAAQAVNTLVAATAVTPVDPWLIYSLGTAWRSASYIHALRVAVVRKQP